MHGLRPDIHLLRTLGADITLYSGVVQGMAALLENPNGDDPGFCAWSDGVYRSAVGYSYSCLEKWSGSSWRVVITRSDDRMARTGHRCAARAHHPNNRIDGPAKCTPRLFWHSAMMSRPSCHKVADPAIATSLNMMTQTAAQHIMIYF